MADGLEQEITVFVPRHDILKVTQVRLRNRSGRPRRVGLVAYAQLDLGSIGARAATPLESFREGANLFAWNSAPADFAGRIAFAAAPGSGARSCTTDRRAFIGLQGSLSAPRAVRQGGHLDGFTGPAHQACFALRSTVDLAAGEDSEQVFLLGEAGTLPEARELLARYAAEGAAARALAGIREFWEGLTGGLQVSTPEPVLDVMLNRWLPYQNLSCRMWGRSAYYQSGWAFGFRD